MRIDSEQIQHLKAFETISHAIAKDCLIGNQLVTFVVSEGQLGQTIGRKGANVKRLKELFKKNIELLEFSKTPGGFMQKAFPSITFTGLNTQTESDKTVLIAKMDNENKKKLLSDIRKVKRIKELLKRNYNMDDIQIEK